MMSEQKYYVKLKSPNNHLGIWWCGDRGEWQSYSCYPIYEEELEDFGEREVIGWEVSKYIPSFTKSELAEIMDGALYRKPFLGETGIQPEWINPLIELVQIEEE